MSKKTFNSKLENLFTRLNDGVAGSSGSVVVDLEKLDVNKNWTWKIDLAGIVVESSEEILDILGFSSQEVIGQSIYSIGLSGSEAQVLRESLENSHFPVQIELEYLSNNKAVARLRTNIIKLSNGGSVSIGYQGFAQPILSDEMLFQKNDTLKNLPPEVDSLDIEAPIQKNELISQSEMNIQTTDIETDDVELATSSFSEKPKIIKPRKLTSSKPERPLNFDGKTAPLSPYPSTEPVQSTQTQIYPENITGVSLSDNDFQGSTRYWTKQAAQSFTQDKLIIQSGSSDSPAVLALPLKLRDQKTGVVEILDPQSNRKWTQEERILVQEVTTQLGLALENAQLYSAVQKELGERVKAEEETSKRNKDLAKLNMLMQQLTRLVSRDEIFDIVSSSVQDIMNANNILISMYDAKEKKLSFPVCISDGEKVNLPDSREKSGYQETVLRSRTPLLVRKDLISIINEQEFDHSKNLPLSLLAVPLLTGDRPMGVISVFDYEKENAFDEVQTELLSTVAAQSATALENATLFQEIRQALETIEVRERYQANVTNAVAALSEKGSITIDFMLESLALASKCDQVSYAQFDNTIKVGQNWKVSSSYYNSNFGKSNTHPKNLSFSLLPEWVSQLRENGFIFMSLQDSNSDEKSLLESRHCLSILFLAVTSSDENLNFLSLENLVSSHEWKLEEINILRIASEAFSNTLVRESLLKQVQVSLNETESLYSASHQLALSNSIPEMVGSIVKGIGIKEINRGILILFTLDPGGLVTKMHVEASYHNGVGTPPPPVGTEYLVSIYKSIFQIENPTFYDDLNEVDIDSALRNILTRQNIRSMAVLPLWAGSNQLGVLLILSEQKHEFSTQETRSYPPLVDQMATAIENLRLFEKTQEALAETGLLYKVSSGISRSTKMDEFVKLIGENALPKDADTLWLLSATQEGNSKPLAFEAISSYNAQEGLRKSKTIIDAEDFNFLDFSYPESVYIKDIHNSDLSEKAKFTFDALGLATAAFIPLKTTGNPIGVIITGSKKITNLDQDEVHTLQIVGNSVAVAIERQKLLSEAQRRALELQTAAEIARDTTSTLSLDILLNRIVNLLQSRFDFYQCSIFLLDETGMYATIEESTGDVGFELKQNKYKLAVGSKSIIGSCTATGNPVLANDVSRSPYYLPNPLLPNTRSELGLPMKITGKVIGAIDMQSTRIGAFTEDELTVLQILADQVSVAIDNARAYAISQHAVEEMRELDRVKSQFLANMSHELRTPLNSVIGFSRVILKGIDGPINDVQEQDITAIYNSGMHLLNMINEILDLSKIEAGKMDLQLDEVNLNDVINAACTTATGLVKDKPIQLIQKVPSNLPVIQADELRLNQVIINLISNAVKFTEKGTITIEASEKRNSQNKPEIFVTVTDTGIGIASEDQAKLFQRFSQVDDSPTRKTGGTGLGLSICRSFIELHGGKIGLLSSEVGKGSIFYFTLPIPEKAEPMNLDHLIHGTNVVLSIDDDAQVISLYERFLRTHGYEVVPLTDPTLAVERARELKPFAITLDIMMPNKDGWQVLRDLKKDPDTRNIPIMICSILEEEEKGFNLGASEYMVKPFLQDDLINAIRRLNKNGDVHEVLVIDDDPDDLRLLKKMIDEGGQYLTVVAEGGLAAISLLKDFTPDIILLDLFMPGINGFELLEKFKIDPRLSHIPVIVLTGADLNKEQQDVLSEFGSQMISKGSLGENELLQNLQQMLSKIRPTQLVN